MILLLVACAIFAQNGDGEQAIAKGTGIFYLKCLIGRNNLRKRHLLYF